MRLSWCSASRAAPAAISCSAYGDAVPDARYWGTLVVLGVAGLAARLVRGGPLLGRHPSVLGPLDLALATVALLALGFHCTAMFFPSAVTVPATGVAAGAVRELGGASQVAYWVPAGLLLVAVRRAWIPLLVAEGGALVAVGATMFWDVGLSAHLVALAASVAVTVVYQGGHHHGSPARRPATRASSPWIGSVTAGSSPSAAGGRTTRAERRLTFWASGLAWRLRRDGTGRITG